MGYKGLVSFKSVGIDLILFKTRLFPAMAVFLKGISIASRAVAKNSRSNKFGGDS
jgi:hypothetical protein